MVYKNAKFMINYSKQIIIKAIKMEKMESSIYNEDYFEKGAVKGISGYNNFSWMPELTIRMAHFLIKNLPIANHEVVLDFGCAKGYIVKALRLLEVDAYGVDVSEYAIEKVDASARNYCKQISGVTDISLFERQYDLMIAKDVFEHISEEELEYLLDCAKNKVKRMFVVVPLAADDKIGKYIIPEYDHDITHIIAKSESWWSKLFEKNGWKIKNFRYDFPGCKENWTCAYPKGNGFYIIEKY